MQRCPEKKINGSIQFTEFTEYIFLLFHITGLLKITTGQPEENTYPSFSFRLTDLSHPRQSMPHPRMPV